MLGKCAKCGYARSGLPPGAGCGDAGGRGTAANARCVRTKNDDDDQRQSRSRRGLYNGNVGTTPSIPMTAGAGLALLTLGVLADCAGGAGGNLMLGGIV